MRAIPCAARWNWRDAAGRTRTATPRPRARSISTIARWSRWACQVGQPLQLGGRDLTIAAELLRQPDGGELVALAPRALMSLADADASRPARRGQPRAPPPAAGRHAGGGAGLARLGARRPPLPQGAELITPEQTQERMRTSFDRAGAFLRLTALLSALLAGIAIALSAQRYARRKTAEVALLRALGTPAGACSVCCWARWAHSPCRPRRWACCWRWGLPQLAWLLASAVVRQRADRAAAVAVVCRRGDGPRRAGRLRVAAAGAAGRSALLWPYFAKHAAAGAPRLTRCTWFPRWWRWA